MSKNDVFDMVMADWRKKLFSGKISAKRPTKEQTAAIVNVLRTLLHAKINCTLPVNMCDVQKGY